MEHRLGPDHYRPVSPAPSKWNRAAAGQVNQETATGIRYSQGWLDRIITFFLDKIPILKVSQGAQGNFSSTPSPLRGAVQEQE